MIRVGVIGLGMMGATHLDVYARHDDVEVVAISDLNPRRLSGEELAIGNIDGQAEGGFDIRNAKVKRYDEGKKLIRNKHLDLVDVCLPTPLHVSYAQLALRKGLHVMVEKPVGRTYRDAKKLIEAAAAANGFTMVGMCMRFWPGWTWLKEAVVNQTYGRVRSACFRRVTSHPGGPFYSDGEACGGALLDLHVHDIDFIYYLFGVPQKVFSVGYSTITSAIDHIVTQYEYDEVPIVVAEGGWTMTEGFGFSMRYTVVFERATALFDVGAQTPLVLYEKDRQPQVIEVEPGLGYEHEIAYFLDCIDQGTPPSTVTAADAAVSVKISEAEARSALTRHSVKVTV